MKKLFVMLLVLVFALCAASVAIAEDNPLRAKEKEVNASFAALVPADKIIGVDKFYKVSKC